MSHVLTKYKTKQPQPQSKSTTATSKPRQLRENPDWLKPKQKKSNSETCNKEIQESRQIVDSDSDDEFLYKRDDDITPTMGKTSKPLIGRGFRGDSIVLDAGVMPDMGSRRRSATAEEAKKKAIEIVRRRGAIELEDPNAVGRKKRTSGKVEEIKKRATGKMVEKENSSHVRNDSQSVGRSRCLGIDP